MKKHLLALTVLAATLATTTSVITIAQAGGKHGDHGHHHDHVKHDAHEHGVAAMNLVHFSGEVQIELSTPAYNVVGFEHQPKTEAQEEAVHEAVEALEKPLALFGFGKPCEVELAKVDSPFPEHDDHKDHAHEKDHHDDHKDHDHEKDHDHKEHGHEKDHHDDHKGHDHEKDHDHKEHAHEKEHKHDDHGHKDHKDHDHKGHDHDDHKGDHHDSLDKHDDHKEEAHTEFAMSYNIDCSKSEKLLSIDATKLFAEFPNFEEIRVQWLSANKQGSAELTAKKPSFTAK